MPNFQSSIIPDLRTEVFEIEVLNVNGKEFTFGANPNLRNALEIFSIEAFSFAQVPVAPSGKAVINAAVFSKSFLQLNTVNNTTLRTVPLTGISKTVNGTVIPKLNCQKIDPDKSKIIVGSAAGLVLNEVFLLQVTYIAGKGA